MARKSNCAMVIALALATLAPFSLAQRRGNFQGFPFPRSGPRNGSPFNHYPPEFPGAFILADPFFWYGDYPPPPPAPESAPVPMVLRGIVDTQPQAKLSPLMIELEGDRYVRHGGTAQSPPGETSSGPRTLAAPVQDSAFNVQSAQLASTVLIFHDGHREEITDYVMVGRVLYANGESEVDAGAGMRTIQLSALDIFGTIRANRENGVRFRVPGPNEVITRP